MKTKLCYKQAFTLVELLVVVAVIAVLAALLLPALKSARDRAKTAQCANNQRQIGVGWGGYLNDNSGFYPYQSPINKMRPGDSWSFWDPECGQLCTPTSGYGWYAGNFWYHLFSPYIGGLGKDKNGNGPYTTAFYTMMRCPSNPWRTSTFNDANEYYGGASVPYPPVSPSSYSLNRQLIPITWALPQGIGPGCGIRYCNPSGWSRRANMTDIQFPSRVALMLETPLQPLLWNGDPAFRVDNPWTRLNGPYSWLASQPMPFEGGGGFYGGSDASYVTNFWNQPDSRYTWVWLRPDCNYKVSTFHNLGMNVLFPDGHVERIPKATLFTYASQVLSNTPPWGGYAGLNGTPGGIFWTDGFGQGASRFYNQLPNYELYP